MAIGLVDQVVFSRIKVEQANLLAFEANELKVKLESYLATRFAVLKAIASLYEMEMRHQITPSDFHDFVSKLYHEIGGFRSLQYANADSVVSVSYPVRAKSPVGHNLLKTSFTRDFVLKAIETKKMTVNDPYGLITNKKSGFIARMPIFRSEEFLGLAIGVFEVPHLVREVFREQVLSRLDFRLLNSKVETFYSSTEEFSPSITREMVKVGDSFWYLDVVTKGKGDAQVVDMRWAIWILGTACSLLLGRILFLREGRDRQKERETLLQSESLATVGRLAAGVAHEILNPLNVIGFIAQKTLLEDDATAESRTNAQKTWDQVQRVTKIIHSLKQIARQTSKNFVDIEAASLVESAVILVTHEIRSKGIRLNNVIKNPGLIRGDVDELTRVLVNLFTNAIVAMEEQEEKVLTIEAQTQMRGNEPWLGFKVSDTGDGISPGDFQYLFEPFFTKRQEKGGTGLGLPICKSIIEEHGGEIQVKSEKGKGSTFTIWLPSLTRQSLDDQPVAIR
jgi:signal transduction histidine kinase